MSLVEFVFWILESTVAILDRPRDPPPVSLS